MVDPVVMMLDDMTEEDPFALALAKKQLEIALFPETMIEDDVYEDFIKSLEVNGSGSGLFIGRHGYTGMGDYYSNTHGNTGMGWF